MNFIFISPHHDDICFSLGNIIKKISSSVCNNSIHILNIHTKSLHIKSKRILSNIENNFENSEEKMVKISAIRQKENNNFIKKYNLNNTDLGFKDSSIWDFNKKQNEYLHLSSKILSVVDQKLSCSKKNIIFFPMAIGLNKNHLVIFNIFLKKILKDESMIDFAIYEDIPYTTNTKNKELRINKLLPFLKKNNFKRHFNKLSSREIIEKQKDVLLYKSQLPDDCNKVKNYTYILENRNPYEIIWSNSTELKRFLTKKI